MKFSVERISCSTCGYIKDLDPYAPQELKLWYRFEIDSHSVWAHNRNRLVLLKEFLEGGVDPNEAGFDALPKWMLEKRNRASIITEISSMLARETDRANTASILTPDAPRVQSVMKIQPSIQKSERAPGQAYDDFGRSAEIMKLTLEILQGSWIVAGSEIEHVGPGDEIYHFTPPDRFVMEFRQPNGRRYLSKQRYALTEEGFVFGPKGNLRCAVTAWLESGFLIFQPIHGKETWSTRMTNEENQAEQIGARNPIPVSS